MVQPGTVNTVSTVPTVEALNNCGYYVTVYSHSGPYETDILVRFLPD